MNRRVPPPVDLRAHIRDVPDFPKPGIVFKDITPLLLDPDALSCAVDGLVQIARPLDVDVVVAAEARGFILGAALARELGAGFIPARKPGKLPRRRGHARATRSSTASTRSRSTRTRVAGRPRVLVHDDLLATGGTARALCDLAEHARRDRRRAARSSSSSRSSAAATGSTRSRSSP